MTTKYCECGCGSEISNSNHFKHGHNRKGTHHTEQEKAQIKASNIKTYKNNPELKKLIGKASSEFRSGKSYAEIYGIGGAESVKAKQSASHKGKKVTNWATKYSGNKKTEIAKKTSTTMKKTISDMLENNPEQYLEWRNNNFKSCFTKPSSLERVVIALNIPNLKYVGNGKLWIKLASKTGNPDFIVEPFNETKMVVEVFGGLGYFHTKQEAKLLKKEYAKLGIKCLVIYDYEIPKAKNMINKFLKNI